MVTVSWLQSDINALPKGIFLTHFVQLLLFSSGPDPKPIRSVEGFSSIQKAIYSVCNRNFQSTIETMGTCVQDWTKSVHFATEKKRRGFAFFFFFNEFYKSLCLMLGRAQFSFLTPPFISVPKYKSTIWPPVQQNAGQEPAPAFTESLGGPGDRKSQPMA